MAKEPFNNPFAALQGSRGTLPEGPPAPDPVAPKEHRDAFEKEMDAAGAQWEMLLFSGILHAYTDQGADVPGIAGWHEPSTRQTYVLAHQFVADAFAGKL